MYKTYAKRFLICILGLAFSPLEIYWESKQALPEPTPGTPWHWGFPT